MISCHGCRCSGRVMAQCDQLPGPRRSLGWAMAVAAFVICLLPAASYGQRLRFGTHREVRIPDYARLRIGPFYSTAAFKQTVGVRYVSTTGAGVRFLEENERGEVSRDGWDIPVVSELTFRNYLLVTRAMDIDMSVAFRYEHYPLRTQDDRFDIDIAEEGIQGTLSTEFRLTDRVDGTVYDTITYQTDYIDARGLTDEYGGEKFTYFANTAGVNLDWMLGKERNMGVSFSREDFLPLRDKFEYRERTTYAETMGYKQTLFPGLAAGIRFVFMQNHYPARGRPDTQQADVQFIMDFSRDLEAGIRLTDRTSLALDAGVATVYAEREEVLEADGTVRVGGRGKQEVALSGGARLTSLLTRTATQEIGYRNGLRSGHEFAFERYSRCYYSLKWQGALASAGLRSALSEVDPSATGSGEYTDWTTRISAAYPIFRGISLGAYTIYSVRNNSGVAAAVDETFRGDYTTWVSGAQTSFALTRKTKLSVYAQHVERYSTTNALKYTREVLAATLVYRHQF